MPNAMTEAERIARGLTEAQRALDSALDFAHHWLNEIAAVDLSEIVADGGITAGMVVQQEAVGLAKRIERARKAVRHHLLTEKRDG